MEQISTPSMSCVLLKFSVFLFDSLIPLSPFCHATVFIAPVRDVTALDATVADAYLRDVASQRG